jgi:hypothetical protein
MGRRKPRIRPKQKAEKPGRWLEELVARIEQSFAPDGATVRSPDRIANKVTGKVREVDVSIRYPIGTHEVLIVMQCRARGRTADETWIEHLVTEAQSIGADLMVAVSTSGFTDAAKNAAARYNIRLRTVREITSDELAQWKSLAKLTMDITCWRVTYAATGHVGGSPEDRVAARTTFLEVLTKERGDTPIGLNSDGSTTRLNSVIRAWLRGDGKDFYDALPLTGEWRESKLSLKSREDPAQHEYANSPSLAVLNLTVQVCRGWKELPARAHLYRDERTGTASRHPFWEAHIGDLFPNGTGELAFVSLNDQEMIPD